MKLTFAVALLVMGIVSLVLCQATEPEQDYICQDDIGLNGDGDGRTASLAWMCSRACLDEGGSCVGINWNTEKGECELVTLTTDGETSDADWKYCPKSDSGDAKDWCKSVNGVENDKRYTSATTFDVKSACQDRCTDNSECRVAVIHKNDNNVFQCLTLEGKIRQLTKITGSTCSTCTYCERSMTFTVRNKENGNAAENACPEGTLATLEKEFTKKIQKAVKAMEDYEKAGSDSAPTAWVNTDKEENGIGCWYLDRDQYEDEDTEEIRGEITEQCESAQHHVLCMKYDD